MLKHLLASSFVFCGLSLSWQVQASTEEAFKNTCAVVMPNDKSEIRQKMRNVQRDFQLTLRNYYGGISCDGNSTIRAAGLNNTTDVGTLLLKKMPKKAFHRPE